MVFIYVPDKWKRFFSDHLALMLIEAHGFIKHFLRDHFRLFIHEFLVAHRAFNRQVTYKLKLKAFIVALFKKLVQDGAAYIRNGIADVNGKTFTEDSMAALGIYNFTL